MTSHPTCLCSAQSFHLHAIHGVCLSVRCPSPRVCPSCFSLLFPSSLPHSICSLTSTSSPMSTASRELTTAPSHNESIASWRYTTFHRLWPHRPWRFPLLRDFCSDFPGWIRRHRYGAFVLVRCRTRRWDYRKQRYLHHCSFRSEKNQRTGEKLITLMKTFCCQFSPFSHTQERRDPYTNWVRLKKRKSGRDMDNERIRILVERQKYEILAEVRTEIQQHEIEADSDRRSIQGLNGIIESKRREIDHALAEDKQLRRDHQLLHEQLSEQNRDLREAHIKSLHEMEELKRVQELRIDEFSKRRLVENQDTINEFTARIQELQNEVNCLNDSRDFKDAESVRSGSSHVPCQLMLFPLYRDLGRLRSRYACKIGKRCCKPTCVFFITFSRRIQSLDSKRNGTHITACNEWTSNSRHSFGSEMPVRTVSQKFMRPYWGKIFKGLRGRPTKTAGFGSSFWQIPYASYVCVLEDKIQDWGM